MPSDRDDGLARIDSMLEDYIPPSHLSLVPTPEEAEALGRDPEGPDPYTQGGSFGGGSMGAGSYQLYLQQAQLYMQGFTPPPRPQTQNTLALLEEAINRVRRESMDSVERAVLQMIEREMYRRIPGLERVTVERDLDYMRTWVIARTENLQFRWTAVASYEAPYEVHELTLTFHSMRSRGSDWLRVEPRDNHFVYAVPDHRFYHLEPMDQVAQPSYERRTLDTTPIIIGVSDEMMRRRSPVVIQGQHPRYIVQDEIAEGQFVQAMGRRLGVSARQAAQSMAALGEAITSEEEEEEDSRPSTPAPTIRPGLNGQRSTYGPPPRGRRR